MSPAHGFWKRVRRRLRVARDIYTGVYIAPYRSELHREYLLHADRLIIMDLSEVLGVPDPVHFYSLELLPELLDRFHSWHLSMGMERAPEGGFRCC